MPPNLIILALVIPMSAAILTLLLTGRPRLQRDIGLGALLVNLGFAAALLGSVYGGSGEPRILVSQMGNWPAPFGITVVVDMTAALMIAVTSMVVLAGFIYCAGQLPAHVGGGFFHPLFHLLVLGVQWSFITGDLFNLFVAFEIMLMASYALLVVGTSQQQMRHAYKYILLNLLGSTLFVTCCGLIYGHTGTLNLADLARLSLGGHLPAASTPVFVMLLLVFGIKTAIFPLWFWLPESYPTLPAGIVALFSGLLTKVGAYVLIRIFVMTLGSDLAIVPRIQPLILISAGITMFIGVLGAVSMQSVRRILSIHIISQVGYMILGIGMGIGAAVATGVRELAVAGAIFFIVHNMVVKSALFLAGGLMQQHAGSDDLRKIGGLLPRTPWLAALFLIAALSLAGLPPLSGFFGKWILLRQTFVTGNYTLAGLAIATSLLTLLSMLKIWSYGFWSPPQGLHQSDPALRPRTRAGMTGLAMLVVVALSMGLGAQVWFNATLAAARQMVNPTPYIHAVLGERFVTETLAGEVGMETRRHGDTETRGHGETETRGHGDTETRRHGDTETRRQGDKETGEEMSSSSGSPWYPVTLSPGHPLTPEAASR